MKKLFFLFTFLVCFSSLFATGKKITGVVTDTEGPIPGIVVREKGTNNAVVTDLDGKYTIYCMNNATLVYSGVGYETLELEVNDFPTSNIDVVMQFSGDLIIVTPSNIALTDAVVSLIDKMIFDDKIIQSYSPVSA